MYSVLVADDREGLRRQIVRLFEQNSSSGFKVMYQADNGKTALEQMRKNKVDVVLSDIKMPIMDGIELLRAVRKEQLCSHFVIISEYADFTYAQQGIELNAFKYLLKPVTPKAVNELINDLSACFEESKLHSDTDELVQRIVSAILADNVQEMREYSLALERKYISNSCDVVFYVENIYEVLMKSAPYLGKYIPSAKRFCSLRDAMNFSEIVAGIHNSAVQLRLNTSNKLIENARIYILKGMGEVPTDITSVSENLFINPAYLSHLFKEQTGINYTGYLVSVKMERAKKLLSETDNKISDIAYETGFNNIEYFSSTFKKQCGITASEYREKYSVFH